MYIHTSYLDGDVERILNIRRLRTSGKRQSDGIRQHRKRRMDNRTRRRVAAVVQTAVRRHGEYTRRIYRVPFQRGRPSGQRGRPFQPAVLFRVGDGRTTACFVKGVIHTKDGIEVVNDRAIEGEGEPHRGHNTLRQAEAWNGGLSINSSATFLTTPT